MKRVGHTHTSHYPTIKLEMGGVGGGWEVGGGKGSERNTHTPNCPAIEFEISSNRPDCNACNSWKNHPSKIILCDHVRNFAVGTWIYIRTWSLPPSVFTCVVGSLSALAFLHLPCTCLSALSLCIHFLHSTLYSPLIRLS